MADSGSSLERLVQAVEQHFVPQGFSVEVRRREFDDRGRQVAEFDVLVSGRVGTTEIRWLIECRDRPSGGAAAGSWIEQLVGRRARFNFNKVTAVSTTGFAPDAVRYALAQGIELRTVESVTEAEIGHWFQASHLELHLHRADLTQGEINLDPATPAPLKAASEAALAKARLDGKVLKNRPGRTFSIKEAWDTVVQQNPHIFTGVEAGAPPALRRILVNFAEDDRYTLVTDLGDATVVSLTFLANLTLELSQLPISDVTRYYVVNPVRPLADTVHFTIDNAEAPIHLGVHRMAEDGTTFISVRGSSGLG